MGKLIRTTMMGPAPFGGTVTATNGDPVLDKLAKQGYSVLRVFEADPDAKTTTTLYGFGLPVGQQVAA